MKGEQVSWATAPEGGVTPRCSQGINLRVQCDGSLKDVFYESGEEWRSGALVSVFFMRGPNKQTKIFSFFYGLSFDCFIYLSFKWFLFFCIYDICLPGIVLTHFPPGPVRPTECRY